ncbi:hypothetical protein [Flavobacterium sp.]|uniref:hypothetical protein n=1 Tax=Flavobacterium sp. TaxID=239 RepID=UPI003B9BB10B
MKKLILILVATLLFTTEFSFGQESNTFKTGTVLITINKNTTKTVFDSYPKLEAGIAPAVEAAMRRVSPEAPCTTSMEVTVTATVEASAAVVGGSLSTSITATVTADCKDILNAVSRIKSQLEKLLR